MLLIFKGSLGSETPDKTSGLQQDYASYSVAASFETEPGGSIDFQNWKVKEPGFQ